MEHWNGRPITARAIAKAPRAVQAMWCMALPLCGMLRPAPLPHHVGSRTATVLLEEGGQPSEVVWLLLLSERTDAPEITGGPSPSR